MCGINGVLSFGGISSDDVNTIKLSNKSIAHRGPDNSGLYFDENVCLGHVRLSIIDLDASSNQPMISNDESIILVFNGEIYNYQEIRSELGSEYEFKTHSDTEVIIAAYLKWGVSALDKFVGMYSFAIYDKRISCLYIARDRIGEKPLYYVESNGKFYFSSEIKSFFEAGIIEKEINEEAIYHYLTMLTIPAPKTFFNGIKKLESGCYLTIASSGSVECTKYWDIAEHINTVTSDCENLALEKSEELLKRAIESRAVSDVPMSIALSGGIDSSLNLHYTSTVETKGLASINISLKNEDQFNESAIAEAYSAEKDIQYISTEITSSVFSNWLREYLELCADMPTGDPNTALLYGISKVARENGFKVLIVGEGGDELGGYPIYDNLYKKNKIYNLLPDPLLNFIQDKNYNVSAFRKLKRLVDVPPLVSRFVFGFSEREKSSFWCGTKRYDSYSVIKNIASEIDVTTNDAFFRKLSNVEYKLRLPDLILPRIDYPTMANGIEARSPFLDHGLIEYTCSLPWEYKFGEVPKKIIKKIAEEKLPEYILNAPKVGFGMLLTPFFKRTLPEWFKNEILDRNTILENYIDKNFLSNLYEEQLEKGDQGYRLWVIYALHHWLIKNS